MDLNFLADLPAALPADAPDPGPASHAANIVATRQEKAVVLFPAADPAQPLLHHALALPPALLPDAGALVYLADVGDGGAQLDDGLVLEGDLGGDGVLGRDADPCAVGRTVVLDVETRVEVGYLAVHATHVLIVALEIILFPTPESVLAPHAQVNTQYHWLCLALFLHLRVASVDVLLLAVDFGAHHLLQFHGLGGGVNVAHLKLIGTYLQQHVVPELGAMVDFDECTVLAAEILDEVGIVFAAYEGVSLTDGSLQAVDVIVLAETDGHGLVLDDMETHTVALELFQHQVGLTLGRVFRLMCMQLRLRLIPDASCRCLMQFGSACLQLRLHFAIIFEQMLGIPIQAPSDPVHQLLPDNPRRNIELITQYVLIQQMQTTAINTIIAYGQIEHVRKGQQSWGRLMKCNQVQVSSMDQIWGFLGSWVHRAGQSIRGDCQGFKIIILVWAKGARGYYRVMGIRVGSGVVSEGGWLIGQAV